jgi:hypothetical protein
MEAPLGAANSTRIAGASRPASSWTSASGWSSAPVNVVGAIDETVIFCLTDDMFRVCYWGYFGCRMRRMTARQASPDPH